MYRNKNLDDEYSNNNKSLDDVIDLAIRCAKVYYSSTKVGCIIIDKSGSIIFDAKHDNGFGGSVKTNDDAISHNSTYDASSHTSSYNASTHNSSYNASTHNSAYDASSHTSSYNASTHNSAYDASSHTSSYNASTHNSTYDSISHNSSYNASTHNSTYDASSHTSSYNASTHNSSYNASTHNSSYNASGKSNNMLSCNICSSLSSRNPNNLGICPNLRLYSAYQAERFGGKYIYACHLGLIHWISPFVIGGALQGAIIGGPAQVVGAEDFFVEEFVRKKAAPENMKSKALHLLKTIPVLTSEEIDNLSELLFIIGAHISDIPASDYYEDRKYLEHQSDISGFIQQTKALDGNDKTIKSYPLQKEKELTALISIGDKAGSKKVLNEIFGHVFFTSGGSFEVIKARVLELIVLLSRAAMEGGADAELIFGLNYKYTNEINGFHTVEELTFWLSKIMVRFTDCVFNLTDVKHVDVIYRAIDYIKKNYMKKITLEGVASHVYLSPSYFSKVFKDEMKLNFNAYLNNVRIDMSKKLLLDDSIFLVDISTLVGYEDQSYFSKVFKKITGVSPGKYRESRGQIRILQQSGN